MLLVFSAVAGGRGPIASDAGAGDKTGWEIGNSTYCHDCLVA